jgi:phosphoadenosine phosphosulfate reductase
MRWPQNRGIAMPLWKNGTFVEDPWQFVADDAPLPDDVPVFVTLKRWRAEREALSGRNAPIGLVFAPGSVWTDIVADLPRFPAIAVEIPKYADGRAFSMARLLRERDGYQGEIRAVGVYIIDQVPLMRRVGIDAFQTDNPIVIKAFETGEWPEVPHYLQPAIGDIHAPGETRPWARVKRPG